MWHRPKTNDQCQFDLVDQFPHVAVGRDHTDDRVSVGSRYRPFASRTTTRVPRNCEYFNGQKICCLHYAIKSLDCFRCIVCILLVEATTLLSHHVIFVPLQIHHYWRYRYVLLLLSIEARFAEGKKGPNFRTRGACFLFLFPGCQRVGLTDGVFHK